MKYRIYRFNDVFDDIIEKMLIETDNLGISLVSGETEDKTSITLWRDAKLWKGLLVWATIQVVQEKFGLRPCQEKTGAMSFDNDVLVFDGGLFDILTKFEFVDNKGKIITQKLVREVITILKRLTKCYPSVILQLPSGVYDDVDIAEYVESKKLDYKPNNLRELAKLKKDNGIKE